jgi:quercetin dioxygenase-like cupin family protein
VSVGSKTAIQAVNISEVEKVKTNHGLTKFLIRNEDGPNIMVRYWGPDSNFDAHAHPFDEMWYVLEGEVEFNDTAYGVGSVIFIPSGVPYLPKAPKGATLLRYAAGKGG